MTPDTYTLHPSLKAPEHLARRGYVTQAQICLELGISTNGLGHYQRNDGWPAAATLREGTRPYYHRETVFAYLRSRINLKAPIKPRWLAVVAVAGGAEKPLSRKAVSR